MRTDTVVLNSDVLMGYVEQFTGIDLEELRTLNPQYRTDFIPASTGKYHLSLPTGKVAAFLANQDTIYAASRDSLSRRPITIEPVKKVGKGRRSRGGDKSSGDIYHTVKKGENLFKISKKYDISVDKLKKLNGLKNDKIRVGQRLRVKS